MTEVLQKGRRLPIHVALASVLRNGRVPATVMEY